MSTLVIDTATAACSVALFGDDGIVIAADHQVVGRGHAERLVPMIGALPERGRADSVLVDCGPGSFTGVRVGLAAALGLGLGWRVPVSCYSSLALLAVQARAGGVTGPVAAVLDGGHGEVFVQAFDDDPAGALVPMDDVRSLRPADALDWLAGRPAIGAGTRLLAPLEPAGRLIDALPDARAVMALPAPLRALPPRPIYGRAPDAKVSAR